jgi:hypothetical protein
MDPDHPFGPDELDRAKSVFGSHGEVVADRQDGKVNAFFTDEIQLSDVPTSVPSPAQPKTAVFDIKEAG